MTTTYQERNLEDTRKGRIKVSRLIKIVNPFGISLKEFFSEGFD
jgi:hypothetical protein